MSKIYEALEIAGREITGATPPRAAWTPPPSPPRAIDEKLLALHQRIDALLERAGGRIVEFVSTHSAQESATYSLEYARLCASRLGMRVLIAATNRAMSSRRLIRDGLSRGWEDAILRGHTLEDVVHALGEPRISITQINSGEDSLSAIVASSRFAHAIHSLRNQFDLILIDTPALGSAMDPLILAPFADGVVLVVGAGKTRWQVVREGIALINEQRGAVLGIILNNRRYLIPKFIYRKL
jgi:hypothetical protein